MAKRFPAGMGGGMNMNMMKQVQKMQQDMLKMQQELEEKEYTAAGGGAVTATCTGKRQLTGIQIQPDAVDPEDVEMLQDMIVAAVNEALRQAEEDMAGSMKRFTGGMPGLF